MDMIGVLVFLFAVGSSYAQVGNYSHTQILGAMNKVFDVVDANKDGFVQASELEESWLHIDSNHDDLVSEAEYEQRGAQHAFRGIVFQEMDNDGDGYVGRSAILGEYTIMDTNSDNTVSRNEFDTFYAELIEKAVHNYGHLLG
ncbi:uncharacterized protein LOC117317802 [Pecten maximus]|uniref:uncharacterized protein LOC117317802 n=1 Tax=Pecten maximus TaxID=6579 RepID=UPI00145915F8|nr:uncharacterized protein LOC117317802 [Pecten maximus]XP_033728627.1 uncharacterized protein LOC117317802 [Pecten maximus]